MSTPSENKPQGNMSSGSGSTQNVGGQNAQGQRGQTSANDTMNQAKDSAKQAAQNAKEKSSEIARDVTQQVKRTAGEVTHEVKEQASEVVGQVRSKVEQGASEQKGHLADQIEGVANALHQAGDEMDGGKQNQLGSYADSAAEQLTGLSNYLRDHDLNEILDDARGYARQQPEIFYTGALVAGFLAGRFFRSSSSAPTSGSNYGPNYGPNTGSGYRSGSDYGRNTEFDRRPSHGGGYGPSGGQGFQQQEYPRPVPVSGPKGNAEAEEMMSPQAATAWTPAEQALHTRSESDDR